MKNIYLLVLPILFKFNVGKAQITLTKANNEAAIGEVEKRLGYDSSSIVPKNIGLNQNWSFTALTINTVIATKSYSAPTAAPNSTAFAGATIANFDGVNKYELYKSSGSTYELMGFDQPGFVLTLTNTAVAAVWPITVGYNNNDLFSGSAMSGTTPVSFNGTIVTTSNGTGTVTIPGGYAYANCLQVVQTLTLMQTIGSATASSLESNYMYFSSGMKFPLAVIHYKAATSGTLLTKTFEASINNAAFSGITELNSQTEMNIYPNPAKNYFELNISNINSEKINYEFINLTGQVLRKSELLNNSNFQEKIHTEVLTPGLYFIILKSGEATITRKLIIE